MIELAPIFQTVEAVMEENRLAINQADTVNGNHGDHMVEIFSIAVQAASQKKAEGLAAAMDYAGELLGEMPENGSAHLYGLGLAQLGQQLDRYHLTLDDLAQYLRNVLQEDSKRETAEAASRSGDVLKALVNALAGWQQGGTSQPKAANLLDLGYMFDLGIAYMQAKLRNPSRAEVLADAAATVSPLSQVAWRYQSGKLAILTLLRAMASNQENLSQKTDSPA
jgi:hypothetical protein